MIKMGNQVTAKPNNLNMGHAAYSSAAFTGGQKTTRPAPEIVTTAQIATIHHRLLSTFSKKSSIFQTYSEVKTVVPFGIGASYVST
jgi:hypothetical protein